MRLSWGSALVLAAVACRPTVAANPSVSSAASTASTGPTPKTPSTAAAPRDVTPTQVPSDPGLVVRYDGDTDIELYAVYIVDVAGELGTRAMWPHRSDCPQVEPPPHTIPAGGAAWLPPPTEAYAGQGCTPTPLPPGAYMVRMHSGYGAELYAAAEVTLPLSVPVELQMKVHPDPPPCDAVRARRAAALSVAAAEASGSLPPKLLDGCDLDKAQCGTLPLSDGMPPDKCTVTLHETLLRIERPAGTDEIRSVEAWVDQAVVFAQRPEIRATSASRFIVEGKPVVIAGIPGVPATSTAVTRPGSAVRRSPPTTRWPATSP